MHFIGRFYHALEQKGRLSIPATFRNQLGTTAVITLGLDGGLFLFDLKEWQTIMDQTTTLPFTKKSARDWTRLLANSAAEVTFDRLGRILLPEYLRDKAKLSKDVVVVGSGNRVEIWDRTVYHRYLEELEKRAEEVAEAVSGEEA